MVGMQSCYAANSQVSELPSLSGTLNVNTANMETHLLSNPSLQADFRGFPLCGTSWVFFPAARVFLFVFFHYGMFFITRIGGSKDRWCCSLKSTSAIWFWFSGNLNDFDLIWLQTIVTLTFQLVDWYIFSKVHIDYFGKKLQGGEIMQQRCHLLHNISFLAMKNIVLNKTWQYFYLVFATELILCNNQKIPNGKSQRLFVEGTRAMLTSWLA